MPELRNLNFADLEKIIISKDKHKLEMFCSQNGLIIRDGKIFAENKREIDDAIEYWDKQQLVRKIGLNSLYGAILNAGCRFFDNRIGQSTTLTGRSIARHMAAKINEVVTGEYNHVGKAIIYGDSVTGDTTILTNNGDITIEDLFYRCVEHSIIEEKEYGIWSPDKVMGFNVYQDSTIMSNIAYVMRHKTKKKIYKINLSNGKTVKITEDHSIMVDRDGFLIEVKPTEILPTDLFICLVR